MSAASGGAKCSNKKTDKINIYYEMTEVFFFSNSVGSLCELSIHI